MKELLEMLLQISESFDRKTIKHLHKVYKSHSMGLDPDPIDVEEALRGLEFYYIEYIDWWSQGYGRSDSYKLKKDYSKRLREIQNSLTSHDYKKQIIALDNAINQWHIDYPVIEHLKMMLEEEEEENDEDETGERFFELQKLVDDTYDILRSLGRLPNESPYFDKDAM